MIIAMSERSWDQVLFLKILAKKSSQHKIIRESMKLVSK